MIGSFIPFQKISLILNSSLYTLHIYRYNVNTILNTSMPSDTEDNLRENKLGVKNSLLTVQTILKHIYYHHFFFNALFIIQYTCICIDIHFITPEILDHLVNKLFSLTLII